MEIYCFTILGEPQGKARPRVTRNGTYTPSKTREYEKQVGYEYINTVGKYFHEEVYVIIDAYFSIPKSASKKRKEKMLLNVEKPKKKPDCDNIAKIILDSLNDVAFKDDSQVVSLTVNKYYSATPRVEVKISERQVF